MNSPKIQLAPMMDWTDRHCRYFMRLLTPGARLYTEMVTAAAIHHGDYTALLEFDAAEHPVALQVGGSDPGLMAEAARRGGEFGYDEININVGCPSDRVQSGQFGACLMARPEGHAGGDRCPGDGKDTHRHRRRAQIRVPAAFRRRPDRGGVPQVHRARTGRDPGGPQSEGKPFGAA